MRDQNGSFEALKVYSARDYEENDPADPGGTLIALARDYALAHPGTKFREALNAVSQSAEGAKMMAEYNARAHKPGPKRVPRRGEDRRYATVAAAEQIDKLARAYSESHKTDYRTAVSRVLSSDPELAAAWAGRKS